MANFYALVLALAAGLLLGNCKPADKAVATSAKLLPKPGDAKLGMAFSVSKNGNTLYIAGSMHLMTEAEYPLPQGYETAYKAADSLFFEIPPESMTPAILGSALQKYGGSANGLDTDLTPAARTDLAQWITTNNQKREFFQAMAGWRAATTIATIAYQPLGLKSELGLDQHLKARAAADGKPTGGFETPEDQMRIFSEFPPATQSAMVQQAIAEFPHAEEEILAMLTAWRNGDTQGLMTRVEKSFSACPEVRTALLDDRNARWMPRILEMLATKPTELIIVGSAHLIGANGLPEKLKAAGCAVEPMGK